MSAARRSSSFLFSMISARPAAVSLGSAFSLRASSAYTFGWMRPPWVRITAMIAAPASACSANVPPQLVIVSAGWAYTVMMRMGVFLCWTGTALDVGDRRDMARALTGGVGDRGSVDEPAGILGLRVVQHRACTALLDDLSLLQDDDVLRQQLDDCEVVADEQAREPETLLQILEHLEHGG